MIPQGLEDLPKVFKPTSVVPFYSSFFIYFYFYLERQRDCVYVSKRDRESDRDHFYIFAITRVEYLETEGLS